MVVNNCRAEGTCAVAVRAGEAAANGQLEVAGAVGAGNKWAVGSLVKTEALDAAAVLCVGELDRKERSGWCAVDEEPAKGIGPLSIVVKPVVCGCAGETEGEKNAACCVAGCTKPW